MSVIELLRITTGMALTLYGDGSSSVVVAAVAAVREIFLFHNVSTSNRETERPAKRNAHDLWPCGKQTERK